jgi:GntR family transcriptional regulator
MRDIVAGKYPIGSYLPSEAELCSQFSVSRFTARSALGSLQSKGYLVRKAKVGSLVIARSAPTKYTMQVSSTADVLRFSRAMQVRVLEVGDVVFDTALASELGCVNGASAIRVTACRISPETGLAVSWVEFYLPPDLRPVVSSIGAKGQPVYALIERQSNRSIARIEQAIEACLLPKAIAEVLVVPPRSPALKAVHRIYSAGDERPMYVIRSIYPAGRFHFEQTLQREL